MNAVALNTYHLRSVNIFNGSEVLCEKCEALLFVPPTIFDRLNNRGDGAALQSNFSEQTFFVWKINQNECENLNFG